MIYKKIKKPAKGSEQNEEDVISVHNVLDKVVKIVQDFGFRQIVLPPFEQKKVYSKNPDLLSRYEERLHKVDIPGDQEVVLAPTQIYNTFRLYLENYEIPGEQVKKWFYVSPISRGVEAPNLISHELGIFIFGENSAMAKAQLINTSLQLLTKLGIEDASTEINSIGCESCQKQYQEILESHFVTSSNNFCENCTKNLAADAIKVLACKEKGCQEALQSGPQIVDFLDEKCREHLVGTLEIMDELEVPYVLNPYLAAHPFSEQILFRVGLSNENGFVSLGEGGDYSVAAKHLGVDPVPALGAIVSLEGLVEHIVIENIAPVDRVDVFVVSLGALASRRAMRLYQELRQSGISAAEAMVGNSGIQGQLKEAQARHPGVTLIVGQKEALEDTVILRDMQSGMQEVFASERILEEVRKRIDA